METSPPTHADIVVVGAGPAGSACAHRLAAAGHDVLLVDQHRFPRDKVCGDGLIPDAHAALRRLGVLDAVMARAQRVRHVRCIGTRGRTIDVPGTLAVLPRRELDELLFRNACEAGARALVPARFVEPLLDGERVAGVRLRIGDATHDVSARWVVLATGAAGGPLESAGVCDRRAPSGMAIRGYVKNDAMVGRINELEIRWHPRLKGGYGWIFPAPGGVFNIGTGITGLLRAQDGGAAGGRLLDVNLRRMFETFLDVHPAARELVQGGQFVGELKGAPLRCSLTGARWTRPGLLVTGEAAGSTYAFTGEGIGKAMETGLAVADVLATERDEQAVRTRYEAALAALQPRFALYERAQRVNAHPWLANLLIWRAQRSPRLLRRMAGVLEETSNPGHLVTMKGVMRLLTE